MLIVALGNEQNTSALAPLELFVIVNSLLSAGVNVNVSPSGQMVLNVIPVCPTLVTLPVVLAPIASVDSTPKAVGAVPIPMLLARSPSACSLDDMPAFV